MNFAERKQSVYSDEWASTRIERFFKYLSLEGASHVRTVLEQHIEALKNGTIHQEFHVKAAKGAPRAIGGGEK